MTHILNGGVSQPLQQWKKGVQCPLCKLAGYDRGKSTIFSMGVRGWDKHVARYESHPEWHPQIKDPKERKRLFREQFPDFLRNGLVYRNEQSREAAKAESKKERRQQQAALLKRSTPGVLIPMTSSPTIVPCPHCNGRGHLLVSYSPLPDDDPMTKEA